MANFQLKGEFNPEAEIYAQLASLKIQQCNHFKTVLKCLEHGGRGCRSSENKKTEECEMNDAKSFSIKTIP